MPFPFQCDDYAKGHVTGDLCHALCVTHELQHTKCLKAQLNGPVESGKKAIVFLGTYNGLKVILKSVYASWRDAPPLSDLPHKQLVPDLAHLSFLKAAAVSARGGIPRFKQNATNQMTLQEFVTFLSMDDDVDDDEHTRAKVQSMWSLLHQVEYITFRSLQGSRFIPKLYGSCGHIFVIEYAESVAILHPWYPFNIREKLLTLLSYSERWDERARTAVQLMDLLTGLKTQFQEEVHPCDLHGNNIGVDAEGTIKVLDADSLLFDSALRHQMNKKQGQACKAHVDCNVGPGCDGRCDRTTGTCTGERKNDNFQVRLVSLIVWLDP